MLRIIELGCVRSGLQLGGLRSRLQSCSCYFLGPKQGLGMIQPDSFPLLGLLTQGTPFPFLLPFFQITTSNTSRCYIHWSRENSRHFQMAPEAEDFWSIHTFPRHPEKRLFFSVFSKQNSWSSLAHLPPTSQLTVMKMMSLNKLCSGLLQPFSWAWTSLFIPASISFLRNRLQLVFQESHPSHWLPLTCFSPSIVPPDGVPSPWPAFSNTLSHRSNQNPLLSIIFPFYLLALLRLANYKLRRIESWTQSPLL